MKVSEEQIWAYVAGELDESTAASVAQAIAEDKDLKLMAEDYQKLLSGFRQKRKARYAEEALEVLSQMDITPAQTAKPWRWWPVAAAALLGITALFFFCFIPTAVMPTATETAQAFFRMPADPSIAGSTAQTNFDEGLDAFFTQKDYATAIQKWEPITQDSVFGISAAYFLGHAYFLHEDYAKAITQFQASLQATAYFSDFEREDLQWNLLLSRLALGQNIRTKVEALPASEDKDELLEVLE